VGLGITVVATVMVFFMPIASQSLF